MIKNHFTHAISLPLRTCNAGLGAAVAHCLHANTIRVPSSHRHTDVLLRFLLPLRIRLHAGLVRYPCDDRYSGVSLVDVVTVSGFVSLLACLRFHVVLLCAVSHSACSELHYI